MSGAVQLPEHRLPLLCLTPASLQPSLGWENPTAFPTASFCPDHGEKEREMAKKNQPTHYPDVDNWTFTRKLAPVKIRVRSRNSIRVRRGAASPGAWLCREIQLCCSGSMDLGVRKALGEHEEPGRAGRRHQAPAGPRCRPPRLPCQLGDRLGTRPCKQENLPLCPTEIRS